MHAQRVKFDILLNFFIPLIILYLLITEKKYSKFPMKKIINLPVVIVWGWVFLPIKSI